ncbi:hypothetical protein KPH14_004778 [Odynerus spinipes]|uniref:Uncharacterized protein n=1 Tax=Odynerus spinipes TaxID=1348599 RepID=A0AAD9RMH7_9HYME|nr:hypothetical protein KPH14_004778 [Odynerus spinipes]
MIRILSVLLLLGLHNGYSKELPSIFEVEGSINRTISEVERLVNENPSLPRLSRHQIVDILYNITSKDLESYEDKDTIEKARTMYQRALMVVLPYKARESSENLKDLYTKPPIVQIISDSASGERLQMVLDDRTRESSASYEAVSSETESPLDNFVVTHPAEKTSYKSSLPKNHRETYSDVRLKESLKESLNPGSAPVRFTFNLEDLQKNVYSTERTTTIGDPVFLSTTTDNERVQGINVVLDSLNNDKEASSEELTLDLTRPTTATSKSSQNVLFSDQWRYHAPPPQKIAEKKPLAPSFVPTTVQMSWEDAITSRTPNEPEATSRIEIQEDERPSPIYVTPLTSTSTSQKSKYSSTFALNSGGFRTATRTSTEKNTEEPMRQEVMDLLASIGLRPDNETSVEEIFNKNKEILESNSQIPDTEGLTYTTTTGITNPDSPSIAEQNTFETGAFDLKKGMQNLTPDVQLLFQRFGLQTSNDQLPSVSTTVQTSTNSYTNFKPLPTSSVRDQEMKEFLARFGLGLNDNRQRKAMKMVTEPPSVIEAVPFNMRTILENIGLISNSRRTVKTMANSGTDMEETESTKYHVFKPHETNFRNEDQKSKINDLLDTVKLVQEGKADAKDVQKAASNLLKTTKTLSSGPDPLSLEEIIRVYNEDLRNEVKRQQQETGGQNETESSVGSNTESTEPTPTTIPTTAVSDSAKSADEMVSVLRESDTTTTTTMASTTASANLLDLESSFGGTTRAPDPMLPPQRKTGLYFLVDWNTFLEVGDETSEKINLRFQPKVGDRSRFIPITVP